MILACFGDSITEGYMVPRSAAWPHLVGRMLGVRTLNFGVSGDTTFDGLRRLHSVLGHDMDALFLEFGLNDFFMGIPMESARSNLESISRAFLERGIKVILAGFSFRGQGAERWHEMYAELAKELQVLLYPNIFRAIDGCSDCLLPDGLHPNEKGYRLMAEDIGAFLAENLPGLGRPR
jgi:acyl-CoA thioesterase-1